MDADAQSSWRDLFPKGAGDASLSLRVLKKRGGDFLVLPAEAREAARSLNLYPAQTRMARIARGLLRFALACRLPLPLETLPVTFAENSSFVLFLKRLAGTAHFPIIAILCGNPRATGRRFVVLVFGNDGSPAFVVKAGIGKEAHLLIDREIAFLKNVPPTIPAISKLRDELSVEGLRCLALDFVEGDSPPDLYPSHSLLTAWLHEGSMASVFSFPVWQELSSHCAGHPAFEWLSGRLGGQTVRPAIQHGDFAPWNIKCTRDGSWVALDWERGEIHGMPAWDWFHYVIQPAILVRHLSADLLVSLADAMLASRDFQEYAGRAGIGEFAMEFLLAYLLYSVEVAKPAEGLQQTHALLEALWSRIK